MELVSQLSNWPPNLKLFHSIGYYGNVIMVVWISISLIALLWDKCCHFFNNYTIFLVKFCIPVCVSFICYFNCFEWKHINYSTDCLFKIGIIWFGIAVFVTILNQLWRRVITTGELYEILSARGRL